jgi:large repetitive protein
VVLSTSGTWTIEGYSYEGSNGSYAFTVLPVPATKITPIRIGQTVSGSVSIGQERDYTFSATAGEIVYLESKTKELAIAPWWQLLEPDGSSDGGGPVYDDIGRVVLANAGTWTIEVYSYEGSTGSYAFIVSAR